MIVANVASFNVGSLKVYMRQFSICFVALSGQQQIGVRLETNDQLAKPISLAPLLFLVEQSGDGWISSGFEIEPSTFEYLCSVQLGKGTADLRRERERKDR